VRLSIKYLQQLFLIKEDEIGTVFYFFGFFLIIGFGMALGNATANALFLKRFGIDYLPVVYLVQGIACFFAMILYASVADILSSERLFKITFIVLAALVIGFWVLISLDADPIIFPAYFLFYEVVSEILLVHSALYLNQNINTLQAKRLSPLIFSGLQFGTIMGGLFLTAYSTVLGTSNILTVWFLLLLLSLLLIMLRHKLKGASPYFRTQRKSTHKIQRMVTHIQQGFRFTKESELLRPATIAMVFMVITYYIINFTVKRVYTESYALEEDLTAFFGVLTTLTSTLALAVQLFITNRLIQRFGVPTVNLFYPLASLGSFAGMIFHLGLPTAIISSISINSVMPAFHNPVRSMFLNVLPQQIQGRARAMTMAIVLPVSLTVCGVMLWFLQKFDDPLYFLIPGTIASALFFYFSIRMNHAYGKTLLTHLKEHLFLPEEQSATSLKNTGKENIAAIVDAVGHGNTSSVNFAQILVDAYPEIAAEHILPVIKRAAPKIADQLLSIVAATNNPEVYKFLLENPNLHDDHFHANTLKQLINAHVNEATPLLLKALDHPNPRIKTIAIHGMLSWKLAQYQTQAIDNWLSLLNGSENEQLTSLELIPDIEHITTSATRKSIEQACLKFIIDNFNTQSNAAKILILNAYRHQHGPGNNEIQKLIVDSMEHTDSGLRAAAVRCVHLLDQDDRYKKLETALGDGHILVRNAAVEVLHLTAPDTLQLAIKWIIEDNRGTPRAQETLLNAVIDTVPQSTLELIIDNKIKDAHMIHETLLTVSGHQNEQNSALKLLRHLLEERFQQILEIALSAMEPLYARNVISIIRAAIRTLDERHMANACEALNSIPNSSLTQPLGQLFQDAFFHSGQTVAPSNRSLEAALEALIRRPDAWLQECARFALLTFRGKSNNG